MQYHHDTEVNITRRGLETTKPHTKENFSTFISRWRAKAAQMTISTNEEEQILMIVNNLLPNYQAYICPLLCLTLKHYSIAVSTQAEDVISSDILNNEEALKF